MSMTSTIGVTNSADTVTLPWKLSPPLKYFPYRIPLLLLLPTSIIKHFRASNVTSAWNVHFYLQNSFTPCFVPRTELRNIRVSTLRVVSLKWAHISQTFPKNLTEINPWKRVVAWMKLGNTLLVKLKTISKGKAITKI